MQETPNLILHDNRDIRDIPLLQQIWDQRPKSSSGDTLLFNHFKSMTGKYPSQLSVMDDWLFDVLMLISCSQDFEIVMKQLGLKYQSGSYFNAVSSMSRDTSQLLCESEQQELINTLIKNLGFENTVSLLVHGYQMARTLCDKMMFEWQESEKIEITFGKLLVVLASNSPIEFNKINIKQPSFDIDKVSSTPPNINQLEAKK